MSINFVTPDSQVNSLSSKCLIIFAYVAITLGVTKDTLGVLCRDLDTGFSPSTLGVPRVH